MRKILGLSLIVAVGIIGYTHFLQVPPASADESALGDLEHRFAAASQSMALANRSSGVSGMDTTADVEAARIAVRRIDSELQVIKGRLESSAARQRADRLQEKIRAFRESME
jgi:hypothetical protein